MSMAKDLTDAIKRMTKQELDLLTKEILQDYFRSGDIIFGNQESYKILIEKLEERGIEFRGGTGVLCDSLSRIFIKEGSGCHVGIQKGPGEQEFCLMKS